MFSPRLDEPMRTHPRWINHRAKIANNYYTKRAAKAKVKAILQNSPLAPNPANDQPFLYSLLQMHPHATKRLAHMRCITVQVDPVYNQRQLAVLYTDGTRKAISYGMCIQGIPGPTSWFIKHCYQRISKTKRPTLTFKHQVMQFLHSLPEMPDLGELQTAVDTEPLVDQFIAFLRNNVSLL